MKRLSFLFIAIALVAFVSLNSCKSAAKSPEEVEAAVNEAIDKVMEDVPVADTAAVVEEMVAEDTLAVSAE